jgi:hypothetical protein
MNWENLAFTITRRLMALVLFLVILLLIGGRASPSIAATHLTSLPDTVHLHGQIRDIGGKSRQGFVIVSTYRSPELASGPTTPDGSYAFDVPAYDNYVVSAMPIQRVALGSSEAPVGFVDRWERINRATQIDLKQDIIVTPGGSILLDAYDPHGERMFINTFPSQDIFGLWPLGKLPVTDPVQRGNHQRSLIWGWETIAETVKNPAVVMLPAGGTTSYSIWGLWTVPEAGTIMLEMDNDGLGYSTSEGKAQKVNIVYEFARTELSKAQRNYDQKIAAGYVFSPGISQRLTMAQANLKTAQVKLNNGDGRGAAISAYQVLTPAIRAKEEIVLEAARQDIQNRRLPVRIQIVGTDKKPLSGIDINYQQINHDFIVSGAWGGDGITIGDTPATRRSIGNSNVYSAIAKKIGFEYLCFPPWPSWGLVQRQMPEGIPYRFDDDVILHKSANLGFRAFGGTIWFYNGAAFTFPPYLEGLSYPQVKDAGLDFISTTVGHFKGKIQLYEIVNEPNTANDLRFTQDQMLDFIRAMLDNSKNADPNALRMVNLSVPGFGTFPDLGEESVQDYSSFNYLQTMLAANVRPDVVGLQIYNGTFLPAIDLATASDLLDVYGKEFDLPFFISELEYPTHDEYPGIMNKSNTWSWHQGHTDQAQADWAVGMYTLALSKPYLLGANWSLAADLPADVAEDGRAGDGYLRRDGVTLRPMGNALNSLFQSWMTSGTTKTNSNGQTSLAGLAGEYRLTLTAPNGAVRQETVHIREGIKNEFTFNLDPIQELERNQQDALAAVGKAKECLAWAEDMKKTTNKSEATILLDKAKAAFDSNDYWETTTLSKQTCDQLAIVVDGDAQDWKGINPIYTQKDEEGQANKNQLRNVYATMDGSSLVMQFQFENTTPKRDFLFELNTGEDGTNDFSVTASPQSGATLFYSNEYVGHPELIFTHLIPSIDVIFDKVVEVRIPLVDLGNPNHVGVMSYREILDDGNPSSLIPSLGVVTNPP